MYRPIAPKMFEPTNPEHSLVDAITEEIHTLESPEIIYWSMIKPEKALNTTPVNPGNIGSSAGGMGGEYLDDLDKVYGEKSSGTGQLLYREPVQIYGKIDIQPILQELTRLGLAQIEQIDFYVNIAHAHEKLGEAPKAGDIFRVTFMIRDPQGDLKERFVYYTVGTINPVDLYNYQYINYQINAEQTNMQDVPNEIKQYFIDNEFKE